jgi:CelD/BcsL family acetyltransferase involved in cellulose biosynthesis
VVELSNAAHARETEGKAVPFPSERALPSLRNVPQGEWQALADRVLEPNGYYLPDWELAVDASARGRSNASALVARGPQQRLVAMLPVVSAWRAWKLPLPTLVSADPYGDLGTPLIDAQAPVEAAKLLLQRARSAGGRAIFLRHVVPDGAAVGALTAALATEGLAPTVLRFEQRACLDATRDADELLRDALGSKKLKDIRRQRNRLAEQGPVGFSLAQTPADVKRMVEIFLTLEASGWKAARGTALAMDTGDAAFIRRATVALAAQRRCELIALHVGETPIAAGVVLRHRDRAFWFKLGVDEAFAKYSPGVQLALELTRHLCADPEIALADSTALPGHPMIGPIWRGRLAIGDVLIPLYRNDPVVALTVAALTARKRIRDPARRLVRYLRALKEKRP